MPNVAVSAHPRPGLPRWRRDERESLRDQEGGRGIPNRAESTRPGPGLPRWRHARQGIVRDRDER